MVVDILYVSRPQVERWSDELLEEYKDSLPSAAEELRKRKEEEYGKDAQRGTT